MRDFQPNDQFLAALMAAGISDGPTELAASLIQILNRLPGIVSVSEFESHKVVWANYKSLSMLGYSEKEIRQLGPKYYLEFFHPEDYGIFSRFHEFFLEEKGSCFRGAYRLKHKNGSWHWFYSTIVVYQTDDLGNPNLMLGIAVDITEQTQVEGQLDKLLKENLRLKNRAIIESLTCREVEVLKLVATQYSSKEIGELLHISALTVETHRKRIMKKLDLHNMAGLTKFAVENLI